jgi:hypothetical protein
MSGAIPPLSQYSFMAWCLVKHRDNFNFLSWKKVDWWNPIRTSAIWTRSRPMRFLGFSHHDKGAPRQDFEVINGGWSVVKSASLAKGGTSKKRPSPHLHKVPTRSNKMSPRTLQTALVHGENQYFIEIMHKMGH